MAPISNFLSNDHDSNHCLMIGDRAMYKTAKTLLPLKEISFG